MRSMDDIPSSCAEPEERSRRISSRAILGVALVFGVALTGCSADWEGEERAAEERCELAAQLFLPVTEPDLSAELAETTGAPDPDPSTSSGIGEFASESGIMSRAELAEALRAHVPEDMHDVLDLYAQPDPVVGQADSTPGDADPQTETAPNDLLDEEAQGELMQKLEERVWAEEAMRGWAQIACEEEITASPAAQPEQLPGLDMMQLFESAVDGEAVVRVAGALDPDHAVALCEEARKARADSDADASGGADTRIEVTDIEGFPLALAAPGEACAYDPILLDE